MFVCCGGLEDQALCESRDSTNYYDRQTVYWIHVKITSCMKVKFLRFSVRQAIMCDSFSAMKSITSELSSHSNIEGMNSTDIIHFLECHLRNSNERVSKVWLIMIDCNNDNATTPIIQSVNFAHAFACT
jgi:hypothetical protein